MRILLLKFFAPPMLSLYPALTFMAGGALCVCASVDEFIT
ncbi:hypothetical protein ECP03052603_3133 [Escherichia coli P0305260.3]|nr:hypothetical protein ECP03052603_3133 [Escherichia coli P0305260.3]